MQNLKKKKKENLRETVPWLLKVGSGSCLSIGMNLSYQMIEF